ncbi:MAG: 50S ribosomal protein L28 [Firmicutes bacterium]|nr:50S ribosomal protein L28 [Bacillota bacterium]
MAECYICGKKARAGNQLSHSHIATKRRWLPNLQPVRILVGASPRRVMVCTRCLKSGRVKRAI